MSTSIFMIDKDDGTLHKPRSIADKTMSEVGQPITECGILLNRVIIGAGKHIENRITRRCPDCYPKDA